MESVNRAPERALRSGGIITRYSKENEAVGADSVQRLISGM